MNLEEMKRRKKELGITNQQLADFSGVPVGTVNKIFSGATKSPQHDTVVALEAALGMYVSDLYHKPEDGLVEIRAFAVSGKGICRRCNGKGYRFF